MRVVLDTNVLVSALLFGGNPSRIVELAKEGIVELFISPFILEELEKTLTTKLGFPSPFAKDARTLLKAISQPIEPKPSLAIIRRKDSDNRILECALEAKAKVLVTGDTRDLLPLHPFKGIEILSPSEFLRKYFPD